MIEHPDKAFNFEVVNGIGVGHCTYAGFNNCFSMRLEDGRNVNIVNFYHEDLESCLKEGIGWPIKVTTLDDKNGVINDPRIPAKLYRQDFCEICCPAKYLPLPKRLDKHQKLQRGDIKLTVSKPMGEVNLIIESREVKATNGKLDKNWIIETIDSGRGHSYCVDDDLIVEE